MTFRSNVEPKKKKAPAKEPWICKACGEPQMRYRTTCQDCGSKREER